MQVGVVKLNLVHHHLATQQWEQLDAGFQVLCKQNGVAILNGKHIAHLQVKREAQTELAHAHFHAGLFRQPFARFVYGKALNERDIKQNRDKDNQEKKG